MSSGYDVIAAGDPSPIGAPNCGAQSRLVAIERANAGLDRRA